MLAMFGRRYIPIVRVSKTWTESPLVLKYKQVTYSPELSLLKAASALPYLWNPAPGTFQVDATNLGLPGSQHFRAAAPDGTVIVDARMLDPIAKSQSLQRHTVHLTPRWASLYTKLQDNLGWQTVRIALIPDARPTMIPAVAGLIFGFCVLTAGIGLQIADSLGKVRTGDPRLSHIASSSSGSIVALLLLLPSLYLLALVRPGEHGVASSLLRYPRYVIGVSAISTLISAIPATFSVLGSITMYIWIVSAIVYICAIVFLLRCWYGIEAIQRKARLMDWNQDKSRGGPG
jgi:hypothetical protein